MKTCILATAMLVAVLYASAQQLIPVASFGKYRAIGVGVSSTNRIFVSFPHRGGDYKYGLTEIVNGVVKPFPDEAQNRQFNSIQDLFVDARDVLWVLDPQHPQAKLLKFNLHTNKLEKTYSFPDLPKGSGLNDMRVDVGRGLVYLSDPGQAAIVVLDLKTGKSRSVLQKHASTMADTAVVLAYDGKQMRDAQGRPFTSNVNGIALTKDNQYFYYKPINQLHLYRIATKYLADTTLTVKQLESKVEDMGETCITHGLEADKKGNIFLSSSTDYSIKYFGTDKKVHTLVTDRRLLWPDSFGIGSDGYLYVSCAQLQRDPQWNNGENKVELPYTLYKVKLP